MEQSLAHSLPPRQTQAFRHTRKRIFLGIVLVPLVPYLMVLGLSSSFYIQSLTRSSQTTMRQVVANQAMVIERYLEERLHDLDFVVSSYSEEELSSPVTLALIFQRMRAKSEAFVDLGVIDGAGNHLAYVGPHQLLDKDYSQEPWFLNTWRHGECVSDVFLGFRGVPHFIVAKVGGSRHPFILRATIDSDVFHRIVDSVRIGTTGEAFLLNGQGQYQTRQPGKWELLDTVKNAADYLSSSPDIRLFTVSSPPNHEYLAASVPLNHGQWHLVAQQEKREIYHDIRTAGFYVLLITLLGGLVTVSLAFFASGRIGAALLAAEEEKQILRDRLARSVRLAELGEMTAGFAHEINNPLQIIRAELTLVRMITEEWSSGLVPASEPTLPELRDSVAQAMLQIDRCAQITASILRFGRHEPAVATTIVPAELLRSLRLLVDKRLQAQGIAWSCEVAADTPQLRGDIGKMQQIFLNLLNNAIDAVVERWGHSGGRLEFTAAADTPGWVVLHVRDNGNGIPQAVLAKIFTPFFTTKPPEKGTGLGLAVCYGLVESMGGSIEVASQPGEGTLFSLRFPAVPAPTSPETSTTRAL